jgi:polyketide cyclase/dehydrase/lipid transport protein
VAKAYYSTVFERPADDIWKIIRDFNNYAVWVGGAGESRIEGGKSGDTIGAIRNVLYQGHRIRQRLLAQSDVERSQTYEFCDAPTLPVTGFRATLRVTPVVDGDRAFVEWWATFDCEPVRLGELTETLRIRFGNWLQSLRESMEPSRTGFPAQADSGAG